MTDTQETLTGGCLCGAVRYEVSGEPMVAGHCHCRDCQKASGAGHISAAFYPEGSFKIEGDLATYSSPADSGGTVTRSFCPTCGSRLFGQSTGMEGARAIMVGTLDDPSAFEPNFIVFARSRNGWDHMDGTLPAFEAMPPE